MKRVGGDTEETSAKSAKHDLEELGIATIRTFCADVVQKANSGHPGAPMGMAPMAQVLWTKHMRFNPKNPKWINRDRFVLSNGHASALLYTLLHLSGYDEWTMDVLKSFRQIKSIAAGHPESHYGGGIEVSTGPLGQGLSSAVGIAIGEAHMSARFNKDDFTLFDHYTYVFCGDGCLQEGVTSEASSLAGHLGLGKLILLYDDNHVTIDGDTDLSFTEDVIKRYESYGWHTQVVPNGDTDTSALNEAIINAKNVKDKPSLIKVTTTIGFGAAKQGTEHVHGNPLGPDDVIAVKKKFGFDSSKSFYIPDEVKAFYDHTTQGRELETEWNKLFDAYSNKYPELAKELKRRMAGELPDNWESSLPTYKSTESPVSTRVLSGNILNAASKFLPELIGGSADLNPSCFTYIKSDGDFQKGSHQFRNIRFGVREHAMCAIMNGLASYGTFIPYCSTFLNFIGYAYGAVVLTALSHMRALYIFTHDSVFLGEDGPTHQPIEKYALCRATPNMIFFRPADGNETVAAYLVSIKSTSKPTVMSLSRQNLPHVQGTSVEGAQKGGYVVCDSEGQPDIILVGTGSELHLCTGAKDKIKGKVRVVSFPSWELFDKQSLEYRKSILLPGVPVLSVEAGTTTGWSKYAHASIGINTFGASGKGNDIAVYFGMTVDNVVEKAEKTISFYKGKTLSCNFETPF